MTAGVTKGHKVSKWTEGIFITPPCVFNFINALPGTLLQKATPSASCHYGVLTTNLYLLQQSLTTFLEPDIVTSILQVCRHLRFSEAVTYPQTHHC